ncbi:MAG: gamma-glutamyl-gamma-aminobutyrate hydrolase family protein [Victivallales bacterium]|nr:gamma-glutamyl-gamma-aminobutyrate hydrolase family protein [Victivallales bacterium]
MKDIKTTRPIIGISTHFKYGDDYKSSFRNHILVPELYVQRVLNAGGFPLLIPCVENPEQIELFVKLLDACVFIGGPDYPAKFFNEEDLPENKAYLRLRPDFEFHLMKKVLDKNIPILGICAGQQLLNIALGGKIIQHIPTAKEHYDEQYHDCHITADGLLKNIVEKDCFEVNSYHHQAVDPNILGAGLKVTALANDGVVEAIEGTGEVFRLGLQFHAERHHDEAFSKKIFNSFIQAADSNILK